MNASPEMSHWYRNISRSEQHCCSLGGLLTDQSNDRIHDAEKLPTQFIVSPDMLVSRSVPSLEIPTHAPPQTPKDMSSLEPLDFKSQWEHRPLTIFRTKPAENELARIHSQSEEQRHEHDA